MAAFFRSGALLDGGPAGRQLTCHERLTEKPTAADVTEPWETMRDTATGHDIAGHDMTRHCGDWVGAMEYVERHDQSSGDIGGHWESSVKDTASGRLDICGNRSLLLNIASSRLQ